MVEIAESFGDSRAIFSMLANISFVMGFRCLAITSSFSNASMSLVHMLFLLDRSTGTGNPLSLNSVLMLNCFRA